MTTLIPGHRYVLANFERPENGQTIQFIQKEQMCASDCATHNAPAYPVGKCDCGKPLVTVNDGTTNEEVLRMLIDRMNFLQAKAPCRENAIAITKLEESLLWLEKRTADRKARGVEGTPAK